MCRALGVNRTSFHDWQRRAPSDRELTDAWLTEKIKQIHADSDGTYGARRIHAELWLEHGIRVGRKRVERLMKAAGISGLLPRKRRRTTVRLPGVRVAPDLVERDFRPDGPNQTWSADITYISTWEGFLYLAHVQDLFSRLIVGWSMADHLRSELVVDALEMALARRRPDPGLVHHSDQGCQGGFRRSSQHSISRRLRWAGRRGGQRVRQVGRWSVRRGGRRWVGGSIACDSGRRSLVAPRAWMRPRRPGCLGPLVSGGFVSVAGCHLSLLLRCRGVTCRSRSGRRSLCYAPRSWGFARSPDGSAGHLRRSRGSCAATPGPAAAR